MPVKYPLASGNISGAQVRPPGQYGSVHFDRGPLRSLVEENHSLTAVMRRFSEHLAESRRLDELNTNYTGAVKELDELEAKYRQDPDLKTIPGRFEKDVEKIRSRYSKQFTHPMAREQFELSFNTYSAGRQKTLTWNTIKREEAQATANMMDGLFTLLDLVGKSDDPEQITNHIGRALKSIDDRLKMGGITPEKAAELKRWFPLKVGTLKARQHILDDPKSALKALQSDEWEDVYPGLDEDNRIDLISKAKSEINRLNAVDNKEKVILRHEFSRLMEDNIASILETGKEVPIDRDKMGELFHRSQVDEYEGKVRAAYKAHEAIAQLRTASPKEAASVLAGIKPKPGEAGYKVKAEAHKLAKNFWGSVETELKQDPVGYVMGAGGARTVEQSLAVQEHMGVAIPRVLSKGQKEAIKQKYEAADARGKVGILEKIRQERPQYYDRIIEELDMGFAHSFAAFLPVRKAERVLQVMDMKDTEFGLKPQEKTDLARQAQDRFFGGKTIGRVLNEVARLTGNLKYSEMAAELGAVTKRMAWLYQDPDRAVEYLWSEDYNYLVDEDLGYLYFDKHYDPDQIEDNLLDFRLRVGMHLQHKQKFFPDYRAFERYVDSIKDHGMFIPAPDGSGGFVLVDPGTGKVITRKDGKPIQTTPDGAFLEMNPKW